MTQATDGRTYPTRPFLAVSAAIFRNGKVLIVRRGRAPAKEPRVKATKMLEAAGNPFRSDRRAGHPRREPLRSMRSLCGDVERSRQGILPRRR